MLTCQSYHDPQRLIVIAEEPHFLQHWTYFTDYKSCNHKPTTCQFCVCKQLCFYNKVQVI